MSIAPVPSSAIVPASYREPARSVSRSSAAPLTAISGPKPIGTVVSDEVQTVEAAPPAKDKSFSFWDLVDIVNPLQHIPIVNTIYRHITGDEIGDVARVAGGALFGGFAGAAFGMLNAAMVDNTGKDFGDTIVAEFAGDDTDSNTTNASAASIAASTEPAPVDTPILPVTVAQTNALFDAPASTVSAPVNDAAPAQPLPLIEVRPNARNDVEQNLPEPKDLAALDAVPVMPTSQTDTALPVTPAPVAKTNVQQTMMDALLKMQEQQAAAIADGDTDSKS